MVHTLPEEQRHLLELVEGFVATDVRASVGQAGDAVPSVRTLLDQLDAMDLTALPLPTDAGGSGLAYRTHLLVVEELARGRADLGLALSEHVVTTGTAIGVAGAADERRRLGVGACAVGVSQAAVDLGLRAVRERRRSGVDLPDATTIGAVLAELVAGVEAARALYRSAADRLDHGYDVATVVGATAVFAVGTARRTTTGAVQVLELVDAPTDAAARLVDEAAVVDAAVGGEGDQRLALGARLVGS